MEISVVIPVFNSERSLERLVNELEQTLVPTGKSFEVIFVNDGSLDGSWERLLKLGSSRSWMIAINLMRNYGQHSALLLGLQRASGTILVTLDDDLQTPPGEIPTLLAALSDSFDLVYGTRPRERNGYTRNLASRFAKLFFKYCLNVKMAPEITSFRAFRANLRQNFPSIQHGPVFIDALLAGASQRFTSMPVRHETRAVGRSNYTWRRLFRHAADFITAFSVLPLQLASLLGFSFMAFGGILLCYILVSYVLAQVNVPGFTFLAAVICLFSGSQMIVLGIFGAYLARIHQSVSDTGRICIREIVRTGYSLEITQQKS